MNTGCRLVKFRGCLFAEPVPTREEGRDLDGRWTRDNRTIRHAFSFRTLLVLQATHTLWVIVTSKGASLKNAPVPLPTWLHLDWSRVPGASTAHLPRPLLKYHLVLSHTSIRLASPIPLHYYTQKCLLPNPLPYPEIGSSSMLSLSPLAFRRNRLSNSYIGNQT